MGRLRRDRRTPNTGVVHVTNRVIEGLPFVSREFMEYVLLSVMARAQEKYPVQLCAFVWMGNHYHIIIAGTLNLVSPFMNYVNGEVAKYIKRFCPEKYQSRVWEPGSYNEERLATAEDVIKKMVYIYSNPSNAGLVNSIEDYTGFSSWNMFKADSYVLEGTWTRPKYAKRVPRYMTARQDRDMLLHLKRHAECSHQLRIMPYVWKNYFTETKNRSTEELFEEITSRLQLKEHETAAGRGYKCLGATKLKRACIWRKFAPVKRGRTPFLSCHDNELRKELIASYREFCRQCREAWNAWKHGYLDVPFPRGAFRPPMGAVKLWVIGA